MRDDFLGVRTELAPLHPEALLLSSDLGFTVLNEFIAHFPRQFLNMGEAEQNISGLAAGLAMEGHTVSIYSIGNFPTLRCLEQIRNDICYHDADVKIVCVGGGMSYGTVGFTQHLPHTDRLFRRILMLPMNMSVSDEDVHYVCDQVLSFYGR